jgi:L-iditol 2-dehydrogenase
VKALVKTRPGDGHLELQDRAEPVAGPGSVVIRVALAGLCGTDLHIAHDEFPSWPPVTLGHEFTGTVDEIGPGVDPKLLGRRVVSEPHAGSCGTCDLCRAGVAELCATKRSPGWGVDGAFAERVAIPAHLLHVVPAELSDPVAVLAEPTAVAVTGLRRARVEPGDRVLVIGPGPIGLLAAVAAETMGAATVVVAGRHDGPRLAFARGMGLATAASAEAALARMQEATDGQGADLVVEASGGEAGVELAFEAVRRRGRIAALGIGTTPMIAVPWNRAIQRAADVVFSSSSSHGAWAGAIEVLRRHQDRLAGIGTVFALSDWEPAFEAATRRSVTKVLLDPSGSTPPMTGTVP